MPIYAQYIEHNFYDQWNNGLDFNSGNPIKSFRANPLDRIKFVGTLRVYQAIEFVRADYKQTSLKVFNDDISEISIGDKCRVIFETDPSINYTFTVDSINDGEIYYSDLVNDNPNSLPFSGTEDTNLLIVETPLIYARNTFGFPVNDGDKNIVSRLDGQSITHEVKDIGVGVVRPTTPSTGVFSPVNSNDSTIQISYIQNSELPIISAGSNLSAQDFLIEHEFIFDDINENDYDDIINGGLPDRFLANTCLDFLTNFEFRSVETDPETSKNISSRFKGDTGFFNESFNQGNNKYSISNLSIELSSTSEALEEVSSVKDTFVSYTVNSGISSFTSPKIIIHHKTLVPFDSYNQSSLSYNSLFDYDSVLVTDSGVSSSSIITGATISNVTPNSFDVSYIISVNKSYTDTKYLTAVTVGNDSLTELKSDKVNIIVKSGEYFNDFDVEGLLTDMKVTLFPRNCDLETTTGFDKLEVIKADLINTKFTFTLADGEIISIKQVTASKESNTVYLWDNDKLVINTSDIEVIGGNQVITKSYDSPYPDGDGFSLVGLSNGSWTITAPYIMPYSELVNEFSSDNRPESLYDPSKPNNGFNQDVIYQNSKGISIHMGYLVVMRKDGVDTEYLQLTKHFPILDYETPH